MIIIADPTPGTPPLEASTEHEIKLAARRRHDKQHHAWTAIYLAADRLRETHGDDRDRQG